MRLFRRRGRTHGSERRADGIDLKSQFGQLACWGGVWSVPILPPPPSDPKCTRPKAQLRAISGHDGRDPGYKSQLEMPVWPASVGLSSRARFLHLR